jgi:hypothetical protein
MSLTSFTELWVMPLKELHRAAARSRARHDPKTLKFLVDNVTRIS